MHSCINYLLFMLIFWRLNNVLFLIPKHWAATAVLGNVFARAVCSIIESNTSKKIQKGRLLDRQDRKTFCLHLYYNPAKYFTSVIMLFSELSSCVLYELWCSSCINYLKFMSIFCSIPGKHLNEARATL